MPTTYTNGLKLPDLGSIDWYSSYKNNIDILDPIVGAVNSKQEQLSQAQLDACNSGITAAAVQQIGTNASNISGLQTAVASKAADNSVVHLAGAETITGNKTWTGANTFTRINFFENIYDKVQSTAFDVRTDPETNRGGDLFRIWDGTASARGNYLGGISFYQNTDGSTRLQLICFGYTQTGNARQNRINFHSFRDGSAFFNPGDNGNINLGSSTNKWKTLNGINPGALSLPDASKSVIVDTTGYTWTGSDNTYVAPADGWLSLKTTTGLSGRLEGTTTGIGSIVERSTDSRLVLLHIPVLKSESVIVSGVGSNFILKFYPCLGNV